MLTTIPKLIRRFYPHRLWNVPTTEKILYLTFDDGPIPEVTPYVLDQLKQYNAKATFFCIGDNIRKNPEIFSRVISEGHTIGNHTFHHLNGWKTLTEEYLTDVLMAEKAISEHYPDQEARKREVENYGQKKECRGLLGENGKKLFRPPYGRISGKQAKLLTQRNFRVVMWDVLSGDYNQKISPEKCFQNVVRHARRGSIIVFHDSLKAERNLKAVLPGLLEYFSRNDFKFGKL